MTKVIGEKRAFEVSIHILNVFFTYSSGAIQVLSTHILDLYTKSTHSTCGVFVWVCVGVCEIKKQRDIDRWIERQR